MNAKSGRVLRRTRMFAIVGWAAALLCSSAVQAQQAVVYGQLRSAGDRRPLAGAIVVAEVARTAERRVTSVTNAAGRFALSVQDTTGLRVRVLRLGHRPFVVGSLSALFPGPATIDVPDLTMALTTIRVEARSRCAAAADDGSTLATVLSEIDKALELSTQRGTDTRYRATVRQSVDETRLPSRRTRRLRERLANGETSSPFVSVPIDQLMREGYAVEDGSDMLYRAPDAHVLLTPEFRAAHCFRVVEGRDSTAALIGVEFQPTRNRGRHVDVSGTMWVDRATSQLRRVEFTYAGLPATHNHKEVGGFFALEYLPDGLVFVRDWAIRMPVLETESYVDMTRGIRATRISGLLVEQGQVMVLTNGNETLYQAPEPVAGAVADARPAAPATPSTIGADVPITACAVRAGATPSDTLSAVNVRLIGLSFDTPADTAPLVATATWRERFETSGANNFSWSDRRLTVSVRAPEFHICDVPTNREVTITVTNQGRVIGRSTVQVPNRSKEVAVELTLRGTPTNASESAARRSTVRIVDASGGPIPFATVMTASQQPRIADDSGRVTLNAPERRGRVEVRRLGFERATFPSIPDDLSTIRLEPLANTLGAVRTTADRNSPLERNGFYRRVQQVQRGAFTADFLTPEVIADRPRSSISDLLAGQRYVSFSRTPRGRRFATGRGACKMSVVLDGSPVTPGNEGVVAIDDLTSGLSLSAVEVYASVANAPPELSGVVGFASDGMGSCGIVALWTGGS